MNMVARRNTAGARNEQADAISVLQNSPLSGRCAAVDQDGAQLPQTRWAGSMQKPVHIVPMPVKTGQKDHQRLRRTVMRDVVMPGIGLCRTRRRDQAVRRDERTGVWPGRR